MTQLSLLDDLDPFIEDDVILEAMGLDSVSDHNSAMWREADMLAGVP